MAKRGNPKLVKGGASLNPKGKPKGAISKKTQRWHILCDYLMDEGTDRLMQAMEKLDPKEYVDAYTKILAYIKPRLASVDSNVSGEGIKIIIKNELDDSGSTEND